MEIVKKIIIWLFILGFLFICGLGFRSCIRASHYPVSVDVTYVYEGDTVEHHTEKYIEFTRNASVEDINIEFLAPAGYVNELTLHIYMRDLPNKRYHDLELFVMNVPDKRFKVTKISYVKGERYETNW